MPSEVAWGANLRCQKLSSRKDHIWYLLLQSCRHLQQFFVEKVSGRCLVKSKNCCLSSQDLVFQILFQYLRNLEHHGEKLQCQQVNSLATGRKKPISSLVPNPPARIISSEVIEAFILSPETFMSGGLATETTRINYVDFTTVFMTCFYFRLDSPQYHLAR